MKSNSINVSIQKYPDLYFVKKEKHFIQGTPVNFFLEKGADPPIDSDLRGFEILKPLMFGKNLDGHTYGKSQQGWLQTH